MAINILKGSNPCYCRASVSFEFLGLGVENIEIIYKIKGELVPGTGTTILSWKPGRTINPIYDFENDGRYYVIAKQEMDLSDYLVPPLPEQPVINEDMTFKLFYDIVGDEGTGIHFNGEDGKEDLTNKTILEVSFDGQELRPVETLTNENQYTFDPALAMINFDFNLDAYPGSVLSVLYR